MAKPRVGVSKSAAQPPPPSLSVPLVNRQLAPSYGYCATETGEPSLKSENTRPGYSTVTGPVKDSKSTWEFAPTPACQVGSSATGTTVARACGTAMARMNRRADKRAKIVVMGCLTLFEALTEATGLSSVK